MAAQSQGPPYVACLQCTQHCHRIHGQGSSPSSRSPSFYSLLPPFPSSAPPSLPIPPAFLAGRNIRVDQTSVLGQHMYSEVQLEGPSGAIWNVAMQGPTLSSLAFTKGWEKFLKDNFLVAGDLLFFKLHSRGSFSVSVYGRDGSEKAESLTAQNNGATPVSQAQVLKKRPAVDKPPQTACGSEELKRMKLDTDNLIRPLIIDIDDDDDENEVKECVSQPQSGSANQLAGSNGDAPSARDDDIVDSRDTSMQLEKKEHVSESQPGLADQNAGSNGDASLVSGDMAESTDACMLAAEQIPECRMDTKEEKCTQLIPEDVPPTPSNADKGILTNKMHTHLTLNSDQEGTVHSPPSDISKKEVASSEEEDAEEYYHPQQCTQNEESSESDSDKDYTDEATQRDRMREVLAKDYTTEAFISKRRPVSAEERQRALQAAKRFKSSLPHLRKLMKESHVYRGFWLGLESEFASKYLPDEIQEATLLDASGRAWSARWLGKRNGLSGGWRKFSLDHGLEEGDVCVFELIDRKKLVIKVHIFRVVELKNGLPGRDHYLRKPSTHRPLFEYDSRRPLTSVKKMRGAITCKRTGYFHSSTSTSRLEQWKQGQAEEKKLKVEGVMHSSYKKAVSFTHAQKSKIMVNRGGAQGEAERKRLEGKIDTHASFEKAESNNHPQTLKNKVIVGLKASQSSGMEEGGCSNAEKSHVGGQREGKAVKSVCITAQVSSSPLQTPPKIREPDLRIRQVGVAAARHLDSLSKGKGSQNGLLKSANDHSDSSKLNSAKKYYTVERLFNRRKGAIEDEFLVELAMEEEPLNSVSSKVKRDGSAWWVPLSHFTKDKTSCHL